MRTASTRAPSSPAPDGPTILITGFEPFGGETINPSWEVARALHGLRLDGHTVVAEQLPCVFAEAPRVLLQAIARARPRLVLALGLAGSRSALSFERVAVNLVDARIADNAGAQPLDEPVLPGAPAAYFTRLPVKAMAAAVAAAGLPAELSYSAGSFVCNQVFFRLMHALAGHPAVRGGFVHLPPLPQQAAAHPGSRPLALDEQLRGLRLAIEAALRQEADLRVAGGALD